jgi:hypothetical protein
MALRPVSEPGLVDATEIEDPARSPAASSSSPRPRRRSRRAEAEKGARPSATANGHGAAAPRRAKSRSTPVEKRPAVPLGDEATVFVQLMVPGELHQRLLDTSHSLAAEHRKLRHQKTILGALLWRHVDPDQPELLRELSAALDAYMQTDVSEAPSEVKVGANLPFSLKYRLDGAALALRRTRREATAKRC